MIHFWCDTRADVGLGHLVRCLALAQWAERAGVASAFVVSEIWPGVARFAASYPFDLREGDVDDIEVGVGDVVLADGYEIDLRTLHRFDVVTAAIDDTGERDPNVDFVINPNVYAPQLSYPSARSTLLGAEYALLRTDFVEARANRAPTKMAVERVFVMMGGVDPTGETPRVLAALDNSGFDGVVDLVTAGDGTYEAEHPYEVHVHRSIRSPAELMRQADIAICAAGGTTWELACIGVPAIQIVVAENQREIGRWLARHHIAMVLDAPTTHAAIRDAFIASRGRKYRERAHQAASALIDGLGAQRVIAALLAQANTVLR